jgi:hypothetical protein
MPDPVILFQRLLRHAPATLHARVVTLAVNHLLRGQRLAERLDELAG